MRLTSPLEAIADQRGHLLPWVPVFLGTGVGAYFALRFEPSLMHYGGLSVAVMGLVGLYFAISERLRPLIIALALVLLGVLLAGARAHTLAAPVLGFRYYGPIEGRVVVIDRSGSDAVRLTLDQVVLDRTAPDRTPERIRISLHGTQGYIVPEPGLRVMTTGHLSGPNGPTEPGGFDFRRMAWFQEIGGVGYTRSPVLALEPARKGRAGLFIHRLRMRISAGVQARIEGENGAFAAAILTGDRSGMSQETIKSLRGSNLAHLLAISGLHMGMLTGFVFAAMRMGLALIPFVALRWPAKKIAAFVALIFGAGYLALSGGSVATERAFIMVAVMLVAILFNRRALTLRAVAVAAVIVLLLQPESLTGPGFQMSFAATTGLVAGFAVLRRYDGWKLPKPLRPIAAVVLSSLIAGLATAPISAAHFNQVAQYGLLANSLTVPIMGAIVMPAAVLAVLLLPFGLEGIGLWIMEQGIRWILGVSDWVASLGGAQRRIVAPDPEVLPLLVLGALFIILWRGRARWGGGLAVGAAFVMWSATERPEVLIADSGGLIGVMTEAGRALSKPRGDGFVAQNWLENDGDWAGQKVAFERMAALSSEVGVEFSLGEMRGVHVIGRGAADRVAQACARYDWVVTTAKSVQDIGGTCQVLSPRELRSTGPIAYFGASERLVTTVSQTGSRLWNAQQAKASRTLALHQR